MMAEAQPSLSIAAWRLYRKEIGKIWPTGLNVLFVTLALVALGAWLPSTLYLTIPLVFMSFFFAYQLSCSYLRKGRSMSNHEFFSFFGAYFRMPFYGSYRIIRNALLSFLYSLLGGLLVGFIYYLVANGTNPTFQTDWHSLLDAINQSQYETANSLLGNSASIIGLENAVLLSEDVVLFFAFFLFMGFYGLNPYLRSIILGASPRVCNAIFLGGIRRAKGFWQDYFKSLWFVLVILGVGFASGALVASIFTSNPAYLGLSGAGAALVLVSPLIPYYFEVAGLLMEKYRRAFSDYSIQVASDTLKQLEDAKQMSEEEAKQIQKSIDDAKRLEEENPPLPPLDDGTDSSDDDSSDDDDDS
jgi:hypothetical protein